MIARTVRPALVIAARILRQRLRDRSAITAAVLTPLALAVAFSILIPNDFASFTTRFVVVDQDGGHLARSLVDDVLGRVQAAGVAAVSEVSTEAAAIDELDAERAGAAIVIPAGTTAAIESGRPATIRVLGGAFPVSLEVARSVVSRFASDVGAIQLMIATTVRTGGSADAGTIARAQTAASAAAPIGIVDEAVERLQASLATFYGGAMAIMFVFFATQYGPLAILADRQNGTLARLLAAPIPPAAIVLGSSIGGFVLGLVSMTVLIVATTVLRDASWGPPLPLAVLVVAAVTAAMGISMAVASVARTTSQAGSLNAIIAMAMASIGGVFIPLSQAPEGLATLSMITPHSWFLRGLDTLSAPHPEFGALVPSIVVLLAMGAVTGAIGLARARRALRPA